MSTAIQNEIITITHKIEKMCRAAFLYTFCQCARFNAISETVRQSHLSHMKSHFISINGSKPENLVLRWNALSLLLLLSLVLFFSFIQSQNLCDNNLFRAVACVSPFLVSHFVFLLLLLLLLP